MDLKQAGAGAEGLIFDIQRFSVHDGPGIRTLVFLKGCPLRCRWCANPESMNSHPELGFIRSECNSCGKCAAICPRSAITLDPEHKPSINRKLCDNCGRCIEVCFSHALIMYGRRISAGEVLNEVKKDLAFYSTSGGGVTVSGGEPLSQSLFVKALFSLCHQNGINTAMETSGFAPSPVFKEILGLTDFVLFDLKCLDPKMHKDLCGRSNELILENARILSRSGVPFIFRIPLIPGYNDSRENLTAIGNFVKSLNSPGCRVEFMPYHRLGTIKYEYLGREYPLQDAMPPNTVEFQNSKAVLENMGVIVI